ncbi:MAG: hypothetical protein ACRC62_34740 [Microcoleus sp.]
MCDRAKKNSLFDRTLAPKPGFYEPTLPQRNNSQKPGFFLRDWCDRAKKPSLFDRTLAPKSGFYEPTLPQPNNSQKPGFFSRDLCDRAQGNPR